MIVTNVIFEPTMKMPLLTTNTGIMEKKVWIAKCVIIKASTRKH